jgi:hypothetical protein
MITLNEAVEIPSLSCLEIPTGYQGISYRMYTRHFFCIKPL